MSDKTRSRWDELHELLRELVHGSDTVGRVREHIRTMIAEAVAAEREAWQEYVDLLGGELHDLVSFAHVHGWKSSPERVEKGKQLRDKLGIKGRGD